MLVIHCQAARSQGCQRFQKRLELTQFTRIQPKRFRFIMPNHRLGRLVVVHEHLGERHDLSFVHVRRGQSRRFATTAFEKLQLNRPCPYEFQLRATPLWIVAIVAETIKRIAQHFPHAGGTTFVRPLTRCIQHAGIVKFVVGQ